MVGIISFDPARHRFGILAPFIEMNANKHAIVHSIRERRAFRQRNIAIAHSRQDRGQPARLQDPIDSLRHIQGQIFFHHISNHRAGILSAVARVEHHHGEWLTSRRSWRRPA